MPSDECPSKLQEQSWLDLIVLQTELRHRNKIKVQSMHLSKWTPISQVKVENEEMPEVQMSKQKQLITYYEKWKSCGIKTRRAK